MNTTQWQSDLATYVKMRILIVDDEPANVALLEDMLNDQGYINLKSTTDSRRVSEFCREFDPDLILLDLCMPHVDGFAVLESLRAERSEVYLPIIVLTARGLEDDKIKGLRLGADDYLTKPFSPRELVARIESVLRRSSPRAPRSGTIDTHDLAIDLAARRVRRSGKDIHFTPTEFNLLAELATHPGEALTHDTLLTRVWGPEYRYETQYLKVYVGRLRDKVEPFPEEPTLIQTVRGVGYRFARPEE